jgi:hypothetical protein
MVHFHYKGWGGWVLAALLFWLIVVMAGIPLIARYLPDADRLDRNVDLTCALYCAVCAVTVYVVDRVRAAQLSRTKRETTGPVVEPGERDDEFLYIAMTYWPYILAAGALFALAASLFA